MLHKVGSDLDRSITATSPFSPRRAERVEGKRTTQLEQFNQDKQEASGNEISTAERVEHKTADDETRQLKLPVLPRTRRVNNEDDNDRQVHFRGIQCFDFSLQERRAEWINKSIKKSPSSCSQRLEPASNTPEFTQERVPFVSYQNQENNSAGELELAGDILKDRSRSILPLCGSILEAQRVNLREKKGLIKQRNRMTGKANKLSNQSDSTAETFDTENILMKTRRTGPSTVSLKTGKQGA